MPPAKVVFLSSNSSGEEGGGEGEGVPEGLRWAFRRWDGEEGRGKGEGKGCRVFKLAEVLEAVGASRNV